MRDRRTGRLTAATVDSQLLLLLLHLLTELFSCELLPVA
jgi:hypothetical protein